MRVRIPVTREDTMQFSRLATEFLRYRAARGGSPRTAESYEQCYAQFRTFLASKGLEDDLRHFTGDLVSDFVEYLAGHRAAPGTIHARLGALSSLGDYGVRAKNTKGKYHLPENPVGRVERPKLIRPEGRYLYAQEIRDMLAVPAPPNERLLLLFLLDTQLRASAAANAKVRDLSQDARADGDRLLLHVIEKGGKPQVVTLGADLAVALLEVLKQREAEPDEPLLVNTKGGAYSRNSLTEAVARLARQAGITRLRVGAHLFARHSPASLAGQNGASAFEIAAMLRHADLSTAKRYVHGVTADAARERVRELLKS